MKIREKIKKGYVIVLAVLMLLPCISLMQAQAARGIEVDKKNCSITISVDINGSTNGNADYLDDFNRMKISVPVYRVADVDVTGQEFTPVKAFQEMNFSKVNKEHSSVTAEQWQELAQDAADIIIRNSIKPIDEVIVEKTLNDPIAVGTITGLTPGMYLVAPETCCNPEYTVQYTFTPYLTALPSSEYTLTGQGSDKWVYETEIGLKPDAEPLYGKLNIVKYLKNYNATLGPATFVFHIEGKDKKGDVKYDDMESLTFNAAGSNENDPLTLDHIPAGLNITVTEVYSGASYRIEPEGSDTQTTVILSDEAIEAAKAAGAEGVHEATVSFTNVYNGGNRSGYGVTNQFVSDGEDSSGKRKWTWENPTRKEPQ